MNTQFGYNGDGVRLRLVEAGTLTTYTQDYAAPLPVVLQAKTGSATTQYVYSMGTRPVAEHEAAAWEYLLPDPLGSVRQLADSSAEVTLLKSYEPYGSVLNSQGSATSIFAYAGEQIDSTGLIYLRARYMQPGSGIFLSRDFWMGDSLRPGSMNGWSYGGGNPIRYVDPSGLVPEWAEVGGKFEYSCNCGWIDWTHAGSRTKKTLLNAIREAQELGDTNIIPRDTSFLIPNVPILGDIQLGKLVGEFWVDGNLGVNSLLSRQVALGIYQSYAELWERYQGVAGAFFTTFSEEDLTSNLIGFYRAVWETTGHPVDGILTEDASKDRARKLCKVVGLNDDYQTRIKKQREIYIRYGLPPINGFKSVYTWGAPRLVDLSSQPLMPKHGWEYNGNRIIEPDARRPTTWKDLGFCWSGYCTEPGRRFPSEFQEIQPIRSGALWRWISARAEYLGKTVHINVNALNR